MGDGWRRRQGQGGPCDQTCRVGRQADRSGSGWPRVQGNVRGIGHTVVEGAKFSGENIKEFFTPLRGKAIRRLPVVDDNDRVVGIVSLGDLAVDRDPRTGLANISAAPLNV